MIENLPGYVSIVFLLTFLAMLGFLFYGLWQAKTSVKSFGLITLVLLFLIVLQSYLTFNGFYLNSMTTPPRFPLAVLPTTFMFLLTFAIPAFRETNNNLSLKLLTILHIVRIPVEIVLLWLFQNGLVPQLMTFEGRNFDILSGITAPIIAWFAFRNNQINKPILLIWNLIALGLLFNIVINAIFSIQSIIQLQAFDQPNRGVLYFPFILLPAFIVPTVLYCHLVSLWRLLTKKNLEQVS